MGYNGPILIQKAVIAMRIRLSLLFTALALLLSGCATPAPPVSGASDPGALSPDLSPAPEEAVTFSDALGRELSVPPPRRVAALIGSFADVWTLAGGGDTLVAAAGDAWTSFDLELEGVSDLGAVKEPNLEVLLAAEPDFVLASANTQADLDLLPTLEQAGIPTAVFDIQTIEDYLDMLDICTRLTGHPENYQKYGLDVQAQVEKAIARQDGSAPTVLCLRATGSSCKVKGSTDFVLGEMLADLGCVNVADGDSTLLEDLSLEAILAADPDYIFAVLQGADASRARETLERTLLSNPAWGSLRAVEEGRFYTLEHRLYNLKPNALWGESYEKLADILYPETK